MLAITITILNPFVDRFNEGGPFFMSLILISFLLSIYFVIISSINLKKEKAKFDKSVSMIGETSLLALVLGFLGSVIGMIEAFDAIESFSQEISTPMIAGGLKVSFLTLVFGSFSFIIARIAIIVLKWIRKA